MKQLLVPVDGSDHSLRAIESAIAAIHAQKTPPALHLVTVQPPILSGNVTRFFSAEAIDAFYQEQGEQALDKARARLREAGIAFQEDILLGPVAPSIADYARANDCDHIIMGTRGLGAVGSVILGSVTTRLLGLVHIPVTLIP